MKDVSTRVLLSISLAVTAVGVLDALIGADWDLLAVFGISGLLQSTLWLRQRASRTPVRLRADLAHRLEWQAQRTGEPFDTVLDRAVSWYENGMYGFSSTQR